MAKVEIRYAVKSDFETLMEDPLPWRVRAFAAVLDDELLGVGGLAFMPDGTVAAFVRMDEKARRYKVAIHKAGLRTMQEAKRLGIRRVVALAEDGIEPARRWLQRLGFNKMIVDDQEVWVWQTR
jgi:RimJ/RimL family protein N-acetyltransferase